MEFDAHLAFGIAQTEIGFGNDKGNGLGHDTVWPGDGDDTVDNARFGVGKVRRKLRDRGGLCGIEGAVCRELWCHGEASSGRQATSYTGSARRIGSIGRVCAADVKIIKRASSDTLLPRPVLFVSLASRAEEYKRSMLDATGKSRSFGGTPVSYPDALHQTPTTSGKRSARLQIGAGPSRDFFRWSIGALQQTGVRVEGGNFFLPAALFRFLETCPASCCDKA